MAQSPAHRFGQLIGELLESVVLPQLDEFCRGEGLYLDSQARRRAARRGKKVTWEDHYGNVHDLDFVIERDGSNNEIGRPIAFIESAWRRYTRHSRNKAQEIQGAILPLAEKYNWNNPFLGAVLAGVFTEGSLNQMRSVGFHVLYFPYESLISAFRSEGFGISFDDDTPDQVFEEMNKRIESAPADQIARIRSHLVDSNQTLIDEFMATLSQRIGRHVTGVIIIPLYGRVNVFVTLEDALRFLDTHMIYEGSGEFRKYEVRVEFSNGDKVEASFDTKARVNGFLEFVTNQ
jgi:hypothetical protein